MVTTSQSADPEKPGNGLVEAWAAFARRDWAEAVRLLEGVTRDQMDLPRQAEAAFALAHARAQLPDTSAVTVALEQALAASPEQIQAIARAWQPYAGSGYAINPTAIGFTKASADRRTQRVEQLRKLALIYDGAGDAAGALPVYAAVLVLAPSDPGVLTRMGYILLMGGQNAKAITYFNKASAVDPNHLAAMDGLAAALWIEGDVGQARQVFTRRAVASTDPVERAAAQFKAAIAPPVIVWDEHEIDEFRARFAETLAAGPPLAFPDPWKLGLGPNVYAHYQARPDRALHEAVARYFLSATPSLAETRMGGRGRRARLRIGMVSSCFSQHVVGYLNLGLITKMDRTRFDLTLFRTAGSRIDAATQRMAATASIIELPPDLPAARATIAAADLDVLHYPEIGMDPFTYFLAFARLAPLQTVSWGHPLTSGLPNIDLFLSPDAMEPAGAEQHYSERLVRLRNLSIDVERPSLDSPPMSREQLGLVPDRPAYVCAQSLFKVHHAFDDYVRLILQRDRDGLVYFISHGAYADRRFLDRLGRVVGEDIARVKVLARFTKRTFPHLLSAADVLLDIPQWSGGKTSLEGLAMGTPIVHQPGEFMRGRHTLAFLRRIDLGATIVDGTTAYADTAARLVHDADFRRDVRERIAANAGRLYGDVASVREFEDVWAAALADRGIG